MLVDSFQNEILSSQTFTLLISLLVTVLPQRGSRGVQDWEDNDSSWSPNNLRKLFTYNIGETKFYVSFTFNETINTTIKQEMRSQSYSS